MDNSTNSSNVNYYTVLGLKREDEHNENFMNMLHKAYGAIAKKSHPDKYPNKPELHELFQIAGEAYATLKSKRSRYDYNVQLDSKDYDKDIDLKASFVEYKKEQDAINSDPNLAIKGKQDFDAWNKKLNDSINSKLTSDKYSYLTRNIEDSYAAEIASRDIDLFTAPGEGKDELLLPTGFINLEEDAKARGIGQSVISIEQIMEDRKREDEELAKGFIYSKGSEDMIKNSSLFNKSIFKSWNPCTDDEGVSGTISYYDNDQFSKYDNSMEHTSYALLDNGSETY